MHLHARLKADLNPLILLAESLSLDYLCVQVLRYREKSFVDAKVQNFQVLYLVLL